MFLYVITVGLLTLGHLTSDVEGALLSNDRVIRYPPAIRVLDQECNQHDLKLRDFQMDENSNEDSLYEGHKSDYLFCVAKKNGLAKEDGTFNQDGLKSGFEYLDQRGRDIIKECDEQRGLTPSQTFSKCHLCAIKKTMDYRGDVEQVYQDYVLPEKGQRFVNQKLLDILTNCSVATGNTPFESMEKMNFCVIREVQAYQVSLENIYKVLHPPQPVHPGFFTSDCSCRS